MCYFTCLFFIVLRYTFFNLVASFWSPAWIVNGCERYTPDGHRWREEPFSLKWEIRELHYGFQGLRRYVADYLVPVPILNRVVGGEWHYLFGDLHCNHFSNDIHTKLVIGVSGFYFNRNICR